jgi:hypothetical protein
VLLSHAKLLHLVYAVGKLCILQGMLPALTLLLLLTCPVAAAVWCRSHLNVANAALRVISHQEKVAAFDRQCEQRKQQQQQQQQCQQAEQLDRQHDCQEQQPPPLQQYLDDRIDQLMQQGAIEQRQQQQQQQLLDQLDTAAGQLQAADSYPQPEFAASAADDDEAGSDSDAHSSEALDAWDAVWFGKGSSITAAAAAGGHTPVAASDEKQHKQQQHWRSSGKRRHAGSLEGARPRDQESCKHRAKQQQQPMLLQAETPGLGLTSSSNTQHRTGGGSGSGSDASGLSSSSSDQLVLEPDAAAGNKPAMSSCWQPLQQQQLPVQAEAGAAAAGGSGTSSSSAHQAASSGNDTAHGLPRDHTAAAAADAAAAGAAAGDHAAAGAVAADVDELLHRAQLEDAGLDLMLAAMWAANVLDIQDTLGRVCRAVLYDRRVSRAVRRLRAAALRY